MITHAVEHGQRVRGVCGNRCGYVSRQRIIFDMFSTPVFLVIWDGGGADWYGRSSLEVISKEEEDFMDKVRDRME